MASINPTIKSISVVEKAIYTVGILVVGALIGCYCMEDAVHREAIKVGAARWAVDTNGSPVFTWNTNK